MLQSMRDMSKSWIFKGLMAFLVISFSIWGIGDIFRGNAQKRAVAKVGSTEISVSELEYEFQRSMKQVRQTMGPDFSVQQARQMGLLERTLFMLTERNLFDLISEASGLVITPQTVLEQIAAQPHFRTKDGRFNNDLWQSVLRQNELTEKAFIEGQSREETRRIIINSVSANSTIPQSIVDNLYRARGQKRILEVVSLPHNNMTNLPIPEAKILQEYHSEHGDRFTAPEYRALTVIKMVAADVSKDVKVSEDDIEKAYVARSPELSKPEQRDLLQVVLEDEAKAKTVSEAARKSNNLSAAAKSVGTEAVTMNQVEQNGDNDAFYGEIFKLKEGQISGPLKSDLGWHVVQVKKITPAHEPKLSEVHDTLKTTLQREMAVEIITKQINQLDDALAAGQSLEDIADSMKLRLVKIPAVDFNGLTTNGKPPVEIPAKEDVLRTAFSLNAGETSQIIEEKTAQDSNYLVVRTESITPSQVRSFDQVRADVLAAWQKEKKVEKAKGEVETIAKQMRDGKPASTFAAQSGVDVRLSKPISLLGEIDSDLPATAIPQVLKMQKGDVITASTANSEFVLRLTDVIPADPAKPDAGRAKVAKDLADNLPMDLVEQYSEYLKKIFPVRINADLLDTLRKQGS